MKEILEAIQCLENLKEEDRFDGYTELLEKLRRARSFAGFYAGIVERICKGLRLSMEHAKAIGIKFPPMSPSDE